MRTWAGSEPRTIRRRVSKAKGFASTAALRRSASPCTLGSEEAVMKITDISQRRASCGWSSTRPWVAGRRATFRRTARPSLRTCTTPAVRSFARRTCPMRVAIASTARRRRRVVRDTGALIGDRAGTTLHAEATRVDERGALRVFRFGRLWLDPVHGPSPRANYLQGTRFAEERNARATRAGVASNARLVRHRRGRCGRSRRRRCES